MEVVTIADTKKRLIKAVTEIINEVPLITSKDVTKVKQMINSEVANIIAEDIHTFHSIEVKVNILHREVSHGPVGVHIYVNLGQR